MLSQYLSQEDRRKWLNLSKASLVVASSLVIVLFFYQDMISGALGNDFIHFYGSGRALLHGANPYKESDLGYYRFNSPLWAALPYVWVGELPERAAIFAWTLATFPLIVGTIILAKVLLNLRLAVWTWPPLFLVGFILMNGGWVTGQPTIVISFMLCLCLWLLTVKAQPFLAGVSGLIFLSFKPQLTLPIMLILLIWGCQRQFRRFWLGNLVAFGLVMAVTLLLLPSWPYDYLTSFKVENTGTDKWPTTTLIDWLHYGFGVPDSTATVIYLFWCGGGLLICLWLFRQAWLGTVSLVELVAAILGIWLAITPYTRDYDYALLILPVAFVFKSLVFIEKQALPKGLGLALLTFCLLYYIRGGAMYDFFVINSSIYGLIVWCCWQKIHQAKRQTAQIVGQNVQITES